MRLPSRVEHEGFRVDLPSSLAGRGLRGCRTDPAFRPGCAGSGGPAGNASLTAWTGLVLLALSLAELVTLLDVRGLISWHIVIGVLLIPPALLKTATTGWRIVSLLPQATCLHPGGPPPICCGCSGRSSSLPRWACSASGWSSSCWARPPAGAIS